MTTALPWRPWENPHVCELSHQLLRTGLVGIQSLLHLRQSRLERAVRRRIRHAHTPTLHNLLSWSVSHRLLWAKIRLGPLAELAEGLVAPAALRATTDTAQALVRSLDQLIEAEPWRLRLAQQLRQRPQPWSPTHQEAAELLAQYTHVVPQLILIRAQAHALHQALI